MRFLSIVLLVVCSLGLSATALDSTLSTSSDTSYTKWTATHIFEGYNNGVSIVPAFSLGRPAVMYLGRFSQKNWSMEPEVRMSYDGQPWSMILWARYTLPELGEWKCTIAPHVAMLYAPVEEVIDGTVMQSFSSNRYTALRGTAFRSLGSGFGLSTYGLAAIGVDKGASTNPVVLTGVVGVTPNIEVGPITLDLRPQLYYLNMRGPSGVFYAVNYTIPIQKDWSIIGIVTQPIAKNDGLEVSSFIWNIGISYAVKHQHQRVEVPQL